MKKLAGIEAARGFAALLVVLVHATSLLSGEKYLGNPPLGGMFVFGHAGVDFFFVLSGFIIYFIHADELGDARFLVSYWKKRFIRIYPTYWIVLAGYGLILYFSPSRDLYERDVVAIVTSALLIPQAHAPILEVAWSLCHEILFYLIFSVLFLSRRGGRMILGAWVCLIVFNIASGYFQDPFWGGFVFRIFNAEFFFGMAVAHSVRRHPPLWSGTALGAGVMLFLSIGLLESWGPFFPAEWPPRHFGYATGAALMLYGLVGLEMSGQLHLPKITQTLGAASYSIYLLHVVIIMVLQQGIVAIKPVLNLPGTPTFVVVVVMTVAIAVLFSKSVEQPLLRRLRPKQLKIIHPVDPGQSEIKHAES